MPLLEVVKPARKEAPNPIIACKVAPEIQTAFDQLALNKYKCTRAELMRACIVDCLKRHEEAKQK